MKDKNNKALNMLMIIHLCFTLIGMFVVTWSIYCMAIGTYSHACEVVQKKLLLR